MQVGEDGGQGRDGSGMAEVRLTMEPGRTCRASDATIASGAGSV